MLRRVLVPVLVAVAVLAVCEVDREPARRELGRRLFFDPAVSRSGTIACADCHDPEHGFSDPRVVSRDEGGETVRHSQPLLDLGGGPFHWDGEFGTLGELVERRIGSLQEDRSQLRGRQDARLNRAVVLSRTNRSAVPDAFYERVMHNRQVDGYYGRSPETHAAALAEMNDRGGRPLERSGFYTTGFRRAFGTGSVTVGRMSRALAAYMRSIRSTRSPYDRFVAGDATALSESQQRGLELFRGRAGCVTCHPLDGPGRAISDDAFHNTGVAFRWGATHLRREQRKLAALEDPSLTDRIDYDAPLGRAGATMDWRDDGSFRTPNLRDVARRPPYMHDGSVATLRDVVKYYAHGGTPNHGLDPHMKRIRIARADVPHLVRFLESLSGDTRPGLGHVDSDRAARLEVRLRCQRGPLADAALDVIPCGDRLAGTDSMPEPFIVWTDARGRVDFPWPLSTHVVVRHRQLAEGRSDLIPDSCSVAELYAAAR